MAIQSTVIYSTPVGAYTLYLVLNEESADIVTNTSIVSWRLGMTRTSANRFNQYRCGYAVYINGSRVAYLERNNPNYYIGFNSGVYDITIANGTSAVVHNADGTLNMPVSASLDIVRDSYSPGPMSLAGSWDLSTIPRTSKLSVSNGTLGVEQTLDLTRHSTGYKDTITYSCGNVLGTIATLSSDTSFSFTPPLSLASQNTAGDAVQIKFTVTTYQSDGTSLVGTTSTTISAQIPTSVVPSCTVSIADTTGNFNQYGAYVQGQSVLQITTTPTIAYGSPIQSYLVSADGKSYNTAQVTSGSPISGSGTLTATAYVTDARGRTSPQASASFNVLPWSRPSVTVDAVRCNADGTENEMGDYAKVSFSANVSPVSNQNTSNYKVQYRPSGATAWTTVAMSDYDNAYIVSNASTIFEAASGSSFEVQVVARDDFSESKAYGEIPIAFRIFNAAPGGHDLAVGRMSTDGAGFEVDMDATFYGNVTMSAEAISTLALSLMPVGYIYTSRNAASPAELFGGTWERIKDTFILAAGDIYEANSTGGESTHTLTKAELPKERYKVGQDMSSLGVSATWYLTYFNQEESGGAQAAARISGVPMGDWAYTEYIGEGKAHNNMPPYLALYMWERVE